MRQSRACAHQRLWAATSRQSITTVYQRTLMGPTLAHPVPAGRDGLERDGAEGELAQRGSLGAARSARLAPARGRLDGQDGQLTARQVVLARPAAQRLDDIGDVIGAGEGLPLGLLRLRGLQLDLKARRMAAAGIAVTGSRRCAGKRRGIRQRLRGNHELLGITGGAPTVRCPSCGHGRPSLLAPARRPDGLPPRAGRRSPVNRKRAWHHTDIRAALTVGAIVTATTYGALPHWEYSSHFPRKCVVV